MHVLLKYSSIFYTVPFSSKKDLSQFWLQDHPPSYLNFFKWIKGHTKSLLVRSGGVRWGGVRWMW